MGARPTFAAGTVATADYLPWARALARAFAEQHPGQRLRVLVLTEPEDAQLRDNDQLELLRPAEVGLEGVDFEWMQLIYTVPELCWAVKPWLLRALLRDFDAGLYLDSDMCVYDSLAGFAALAAETGIALSPHALSVRTEPNLESDDDLFQLGLFNAGLIGVGRGGGEFLDWWAGKLTRHCTDVNPAYPHRFSDQKWLDLVVNYFPYAVERDPGTNVARWNLFQRELRLADDATLGRDRFLVDGAPLRLFHFSTFDPSRPGRLREATDPHPWMDASRSPALHALLRDYAARLIEAGWEPRRSQQAVQLLGGVELTKPVKAALRAALVEAERQGVAPSCGPRDPAQVQAWLRAPVSAGGLSWYLWGLLASHAGVLRAFPQALGADEQRYIAWSQAEGIAQGLVPGPLAGPATPVSLSGVRRFAVLVEADEVLDAPQLLAGLADEFSAEDDVTLVLRAPGLSAEDLVPELEPRLAASGLDGPDSLDMLALLDPIVPGLLAPRLGAILTRRAIHPALAQVPVAGDAVELRALVDAHAG